MYETIWNPKTARKAAPTRHRAAEKWLYPVGSSEETWIFSKFGISLAQDVSGRRRGGHEVKAGAGTSSQVKEQSGTSFNANPAERGSFVGISHRLMDSKACRRSDRKAIRRGIPPQSPLAFSNGLGLELSEARKTGQRTRRRSHTALETLQMAAYKKTPIGLAPIWSFLTRAASSWFLISDAHGRRGGKLHICLWLETGRRYRLFPLSVSLQKENALPCISGFITAKMYARRRLNNSCAISRGILRDQLFSCGIEACLIGLAWLNGVLIAIKELLLISFRDTHLSLIPLNLYGHSLKGLPQTLCQKIWIILKKSFFYHYAEFVTPNASCGRAYGLRNYHGNSISITYA